MTTAINTKPQLCGVTIYSSRPEVLSSFYAHVFDTELKGGVDHLSGEAMFRTQFNGVEFEVIGTNSMSGGSSVQPSVQVADVARVVERALDANGSVHLAAADHDWGSFAIILDPDGNRIGLYTPAQHATTKAGT